MTAILKIKIMPEQNIDLEKLKANIETAIKKVKGKVDKIEEQEIAFGLKALIVTLVWPEEQETEDVENALKKIKKVSSVDIIDYRRAFG